MVVKFSEKALRIISMAPNMMYTLCSDNKASKGVIQVLRNAKGSGRIRFSAE